MGRAEHALPPRDQCAHRHADAARNAAARLRPLGSRAQVSTSAASLCDGAATCTGRASPDARSDACARHPGARSNGARAQSRRAERVHRLSRFGRLSTSSGSRASRMSDDRASEPARGVPEPSAEPARYPRVAAFRDRGGARAAPGRVGHFVTVRPRPCPIRGFPTRPAVRVGKVRVGNRFCILPMEGWDGTRDGKPSELTVRRWQNFGRSGAKLIWGGEAVAVRHDGRANPHQLMLTPTIRSRRSRRCAPRWSHRMWGASALPRPTTCMSAFN